jgi:hypothetical protein
MSSVDQPREYWMIYREPGSSPPFPAGKIPPATHRKTEKERQLADEGGGGGGGVGTARGTKSNDGETACSSVIIQYSMDQPIRQQLPGPYKNNNRTYSAIIDSNNLTSLLTTLHISLIANVKPLWKINKLTYETSTTWPDRQQQPNLIDSKNITYQTSPT